MIKFTIGETDALRRADSFVHNLLPDAPLSYRKKIITAGHFRINGNHAPPDAILRAGDEATLKESAKTAACLSNHPPSIDLLYEDSWVMVVNKRGELAMHATAEVDGDNLVDLGSAFLAHRGEAGKLRPVNRLDRGTSGAVILARSSTSAGMFGRFVKEEGLQKIYLAVVEGTIEPEGFISEPLKGKEAETRFRLVFQGEREALVLLYPVTGRMHQLRQHLALIGHPIVGDRRYGGRPLCGYEGHALHSFRTSFIHPATGERVVVPAPLPACLISLIRQLSGKTPDEIFGALIEATSGQ